MDTIHPVLAANAPLLHAATRAWQRIPVFFGQCLTPLDIKAPGDRELAEDAEPGDLVLIPCGGLWNVALVIDTHHTHETHVQVACIGWDRTESYIEMIAKGGPYPPVPAVFFMQRNNCYRTHQRPVQVQDADQTALPSAPETQSDCTATKRE